MKAKAIVIRRAHKADILDIWHLFHAEGIALSVGDVEERLDNCYVVERGTKVLGAYNHSDGQQPELIAVHPLYPQKVVEDIMIKVVNNLLDKVFA